jgi:hypothetical protein
MAEIRGRVWRYRGRATVDGTVVARADFSAVIVEKKREAYAASGFLWLQARVHKSPNSVSRGSSINPVKCFSIAGFQNSARTRSHT